MEADIIEKLEDYRGRLKALKDFEEDLTDINFDRLAIQKLSSFSFEYISSGIDLEKEPDIRDDVLVIIRKKIKYYEDKIKEL